MPDDDNMTPEPPRGYNDWQFWIIILLLAALLVYLALVLLSPTNPFQYIPGMPDNL